MIRKNDGYYTYFATDIAYHLEKWKRGFSKAINIWGADHHGYVQRMKAALEANGLEKDWLSVLLIQLVKLWEGGEEIKKLREEVKSLIQKDVTINIEEVRMPELDAQLVAQNISRQIVQRVSHRRAMKRALISAMKIGAKGIKVCCAGRLGGAEIARREWKREGRVPLHTLNANIDYSCTTAFTIYGTVGLKVWIYKGPVK